jgi:hypothetical protein
VLDWVEGIAMNRAQATIERLRKQHLTVYAFVQYSDDEITELVCTSCIRAEDQSDVTITEPGAVVCDRCGEVYR